MEERLEALLGAILVFGVVDTFGGVGLAYGIAKGGLCRFAIDVD